MVKKHVLAEAGSPSSPVLSLAEGKAAVWLLRSAGRESLGSSRRVNPLCWRAERTRST